MEIGSGRNGSKKAVILRLLQRLAGAGLEKLMAATGWQSHSMRGFLSAAVGKTDGIESRL